MKSHSNDPNMPEGPYENNCPLSPSDMVDSSPSQWHLYDYFPLLSPWNIEEGEDGDSETRHMMLSHEPLNHHHQDAPQMVAAPVVCQDSKHDFQKNPLDVAPGIAVALNWSHTDMSGNSAVPPPTHAPIALSPCQAGCQHDAKGKALASASPPTDPRGTAVVMPALPSREEKTGIQGTQATSESPSKDSDGDLGGGAIPIPEDIDPVQAKLLKRKLANRESAMRSRLRKKEHITELGNQASQLKGEKSLLQEQLSEINQKRDAALADNRILRADIESLRADVKLAEEIVKSLTGMYPGLEDMNQATNTIMPSASVDGSTSDTIMHSQQTWNAFPDRPDQSVVAEATLQDGLQGELSHNSPAPVETIPFNDLVRAGRSMNTMQNVGHFRPDDISTGTEGAGGPDLSDAITKNK